MPTAKILYIQNDMVIELDELYDVLGEDYVNNASVSFELKQGDTLVQASTIMDYVAGSNGKYQGILDASVELSERLSYTTEVTVAGTAEAFWVLPTEAKYRDS